MSTDVAQQSFWLGFNTGAITAILVVYGLTFAILRWWPR